MRHRLTVLDARRLTTKPNEQQSRYINDTATTAQRYSEARTSCEASGQRARWDETDGEIASNLKTRAIKVCSANKNTRVTGVLILKK